MHYFFRDSSSHSAGPIVQDLSTAEPSNPNEITKSMSIVAPEPVVPKSSVKTATKKDKSCTTSVSPVYKNNLNYIRKRPKNPITMADLEQAKDLEEEEFKTNVKPDTSREMATRICKKAVTYQFDEDIDESLDEVQDDTENEESCDGYSSPDIDYEAVANYEENYEKTYERNYEQNSTESTKIHADSPDKKSTNENLIESTKNSTQNVANDTTEERKNDEDTMNYWNHQINEAFSEYNALWAKYGDKLEKQCKITAEYFEERPKQVSGWIPDWPADKKMEKLLSFRNDILNHFKRCLAIRGISK